MHRGQEARCFETRRKILSFFGLGREPNQRGKARWRAGSWLPVHLSRLGFGLFLSPPGTADESNDQNHQILATCTRRQFSSDLAPERVSQRGPSVAVDGGAAPQSEGGDTFFFQHASLQHVGSKEDPFCLRVRRLVESDRKHATLSLTLTPHPHRSCCARIQTGFEHAQIFFCFPVFRQDGLSRVLSLRPFDCSALQQGLHPPPR